MSTKFAVRALDSLLEKAAPRPTKTKVTKHAGATKTNTPSLQGSKVTPKFIKGSFKSVIKAQSSVRRSERAISNSNKALRDASLRVHTDEHKIESEIKAERLQRNVEALQPIQSSDKTKAIKKRCFIQKVINQ
ncbi:hypothetical protein MT418_004473 [Batrachochytrium dendrobatidis]